MKQAMKERSVLLALLLNLGAFAAMAQDYSAASIPAGLIENANCVIRESATELTLQSVNSYTSKKKLAITVLNKEGDGYAALKLSYDKNSSVDIKQITIYDGNGKKFKTIKSSEIEDFNASGGAELFSEDRIKYYQPVNATYPYTVEYLIENKLNNALSYGVFRPQAGYNVSVEHASYSLTYPADLVIKRKEVRTGMTRSESLKNYKTEVWEVKDLKALESEPFGASLLDRIPCVYFMPAELVYEKYRGMAGDWKEFGGWVYSLYQGRDILSPSDKEKVASLAGLRADTLTIIDELYRYVQGKTRYVAITMGLGGFQPFDAKTVSETGYGDCKALTNYMYSLLKEAGIPSFPALVSSGTYSERIFRDFPNFQQFDHVILSVPFRKDTIWLECTDQDAPFGFLGSFTGDRDALLLTADGGRFARTSRYDAEANVRNCRAEFIIDEDGSAICSLATVFQGLQYDNMTGLLTSNYDEQRKSLLSRSLLPSLQIKNFSIVNNKTVSPSALITESSVSKSYCSFSGGYMILPLNLVNVQKPISKMLRERKSEVLINWSFVDNDTLIFRIPENYVVETLPPGNSFESEFGSYECTVSHTGTEIVYTRKILIKKGYYAPTEYARLYDFIIAVSKYDNLKAILIKKS
jgi:hypothetical protein